MMNDAIPTEVRLMMDEMVRTCYRHHVGLSGFVFGKDPTFVMMFGTITDNIPKRREVHTMLFDVVEGSGVKPTILPEHS